VAGPKQAKPRKLIAPPDLQALVTRHGGYDKITPQAWAEYDAAMADWQYRVRNGSAEIEEWDDDMLIACRATHFTDR
jgi:hypothetical protein